MSQSTDYRGPLRPAAETLGQVVALANKVFRTTRKGDMGAEYPQLFDPDRTENLRIMTSSGEPVSLIGMIIEDATVAGCPLRTASIGSVCTDPDHRGHGLAGMLMDDAVRRATEAGAAVMRISGNRTLYSRRGAYAEGRYCRYDLPADLLAETDPELTVAKVPADQCRAALRLFEGEPVRFRRTEADYALQISASFTQDRPGATYLIRRGAEPVAVASVSLQSPPEDQTKTLRVAELAGSRPAVAASLRRIASQWGAEAVSIEAYESDVAMAEALAPTGAERKIVGFHGTLKLLAAGKLWQDFTPLISERIGAVACERIHIKDQADELAVHTLSFALDGESVTINGPREIVAALFGSPTLDPLAEQSGTLASLLRAALPLPLPMYGMNYV